jgi:cell division protein FtsZ
MVSKIQFEMPKEKSSIIKVIGVGGGGGNAVNHMYSQGIKGVDFLICNTDSQALDMSPIPNKIQLGANLTEGRGAGSNPEVGRKAAMESIEEIIDGLGVNTRMLFITAGMGGGTGTGAAPIIAKTAREFGMLTVGIVTMPFTFEGKRRKQFAEEGLNNFKKNVDCLLVISNEKIKEAYGNMSLRTAFSEADSILTIAAKGIAEIITVPGYINVDFEDVKTVMTSSGVALMGSATASGEDRAIRAAQQALASPLLNDSDIRGAKNILLNITSGKKEVLMDEISVITGYIQDEAGVNADMIWGNCYDETLEEELSVTIIATGFETRENKLIVNSPFEEKIVHNISDIQEAPVVEDKAKDEEMVLKQVTLPFSEITNKIEEGQIIDLEIKAELELQQRIEELKEKLEMEQRADEPTPPIKKDVMADLPTVPPQPEPEAEEKKLEVTASYEPPVPPVRNEAETETVAEGEVDEEEEDRIRKIKQRIIEMRNLNLSLSTEKGLNDLEKEPAYLRKKVTLNDVPHSSESNVSRFTLSEDENKKPEIKGNNSFLHDNVD